MSNEEQTFDILNQGEETQVNFRMENISEVGLHCMQDEDVKLRLHRKPSEYHTSTHKLLKKYKT